MVIAQFCSKSISHCLYSSAPEENQVTAAEVSTIDVSVASLIEEETILTEQETSDASNVNDIEKRSIVDESAANTVEFHAISDNEEGKIISSDPTLDDLIHRSVEEEVLDDLSKNDSDSLQADDIEKESNAEVLSDVQYDNTEIINSTLAAGNAEKDIIQIETCLEECIPDLNETEEYSLQTEPSIDDVNDTQKDPFMAEETNLPASPIREDIVSKGSSLDAKSNDTKQEDLVSVELDDEEIISAEANNNKPVNILSFESNDDIIISTNSNDNKPEDMASAEFEECHLTEELDPQSVGDVLSGEPVEAVIKSGTLSVETLSPPADAEGALDVPPETDNIPTHSISSTIARSADMIDDVAKDLDTSDIADNEANSPQKESHSTEASVMPDEYSSNIDDHEGSEFDKQVTDQEVTLR